MKQRTKSVFRMLAIGLLVALLLVGCVTLVLAEENTAASAEDVLTYDGLSARMKEYGGIRSVYLVDTDAVASLEAEGYKVAYGAVMAIASYNGETLNTTRSLTVAGDIENGYTTANANAAAVVVYATDAPDYATGIYLDKSKSSFAFTTTFQDALSEKYALELVYTGFVAVTDAEGNQSIVYDYAEGTLFGSESSTYGSGTSALDVADWFVNNYSKDAVKAYNYNKNNTLKRVLTACGKEVRTLEAPVTLTPIEGEVSLGKPIINQFVADARVAYSSAAYADYTTSLIGTSYNPSRTNMYDIPLPVTISWALGGNGTPTYTVTLATDASFKENVRTYKTTETSIDVYNLFTDTTYYYKVKATTADGVSFESAVSTFKTADTVRWCYVDGVRNVRDIGGWTGLNQGLVYRGAEFNKTQSYTSDITEAGIFAAKNELGIKVDYDIRPASNNGAFGTNSPLGEDVKWLNHAVSAYVFKSAGYAPLLREFIDYDNYPLYIHCVGGADRTGTALFMLEGLCGVSEADLNIDYELTAFSAFGTRYRYDNGSQTFGSMVSQIKEYEGTTLQKKFETAFHELYGFSEAEISNVQAIMTQNGAVYDFAEGENGDILPEDFADGKFTLPTFTMRESTTVTSVTVEGVSLDFTFDAETLILTVDGAKLFENGVLAGIGMITFDDGATLRFYVETPVAEQLVGEIVGGAYDKLFYECDAVTAGTTVTVTHNGSFEIPSILAVALYHAGYESISATIPAGVTVTVYNADDSVLSTVTYAEETAAKITLRAGKIAFTADDGTLTLKDLWINLYGSNWADEVMAGDYKAFFGTGTNGMTSDGMPILIVENDANFDATASNVAKLVSLGYTHITFTVDIVFPDGTTGCCLAIRHAGQRFEWLYPALAAADGRIKATVTLALDGTTMLQLITRTCPLNADGTANPKSGYAEATPDSFIISGVVFARTGTEGVVDLKEPVEEPDTPVDPDPVPDPDPEPEPEPEPEPDPEEPTLAEKIASGDVAWLISTGSSHYTVTDGTIATKGTLRELKFSNEALETLRAAGYTKLTFTMSCVATNGEEDNLKRIVCRWYNTNWVSSPNKNDLGTGTPPTPSGTTKTVTFDLTEETCGAGLFIRLEVQYRTDITDRGILTLTDFSVS